MSYDRRVWLERAIAVADAEGISGPISDDAIELALPVVVGSVTDVLRGLLGGRLVSDAVLGDLRIGAGFRMEQE